MYFRSEMEKSAFHFKDLIILCQNPFTSFYNNLYQYTAMITGVYGTAHLFTLCNCVCVNNMYIWEP